MKVDSTHIGEADLPAVRSVAASAISKAPTATLLILIGLLMTGLKLKGIEISYLAATAAVLVPASIVSAIAPRWAQSRGIFFRHPALFTGYLATIIVAASPLIPGLNLNPTPEDAAIIVSGLMVLVGLAFPRDGFPAWWTRLLGEPIDPDQEVEELGRERLALPEK